MIRIYPLILIVQAFCLYHAYKNRKESIWYFVIIFLPVLGSMFYVFIHFMNRSNLENVSEKIKSTVNRNHDIDKLLKESKFTDTFANRIKLADLYAEKREYEKAISLYESCLQGYNSEDQSTLEKLMVARYFLDDYEGVVSIGKKLNPKKEFKNSEARIFYAWALHLSNNSSIAEEIFQDMDIRFGNYIHRTEYAKFLIEFSRDKEAFDLLESMQDEIDHMGSAEKRQKREISKAIKSIHKSIR